MLCLLKLLRYDIFLADVLFRIRFYVRIVVSVLVSISLLHVVNSQRLSCRIRLLWLRRIDSNAVFGGVNWGLLGVSGWVAGPGRNVPILEVSVFVVGVLHNQRLSELSRILSWRRLKACRVRWVDLAGNERRPVEIWSQVLWLCLWSRSLSVVVPWVRLLIRVVYISDIVPVFHVLLVQRLPHLWLRLFWRHHYSRYLVHRRIWCHLLLNHLFLFDLVLNEIHRLLNLL